MELTTETQYIPALLWDSLQNICYQLDAKFVTDVAKLIKVPAAELKRRVLGTRGMKTAVTVADGPWWLGQQCPLMELRSNLWKRCGALCDASGFCMKHSGFKQGSAGLRHKDDPHFAAVSRRIPVRADDNILWACVKTGAVYNGLGARLPEYKCILGGKPILICSTDLHPVGLNNTDEPIQQELPLPNHGTNAGDTNTADTE